MIRITATILLLYFAVPVQAQRSAPDSSAPVISGTVLLSADLYSMDADPSGSLRARRPASLLRLVATPIFRFGDISLPVTIALSSRQTNRVTPTAREETLLQYLQNPLNRLSISPRWGWAEFHIGTHVPRYSELSTGNLSVFGAGVDLQPGDLRVAGFAGTSQRAVEPDSAAGVRGAYARRFYAARFAVGRENIFGVTVVRSYDDQTSLRTRPSAVLPQEGVLASVDLTTELADGLRLKGELAGSAFTRNQFSKNVERDELPFVEAVMPLRESTRLDYAARGALIFDRPHWGVSASVKYLGAGFVPLGYPFAQTDIIEATIGPRFRLASPAVQVSGTIGYRVNNISGTQSQTATQLIGSANLVAQITGGLSVSANYANYGMRSAVRDDTLLYEMVSQTISVIPVYVFATDVGTHSVSASLSLDDVTDHNTTTGGERRHSTVGALLGYTLSLSGLPLATSLTLNGVHNDQELHGMTLYSAAAGASYRLFDNRLTPAVRLAFTRTSIGSFSADNQVQARVEVAWEFMRATVLRAAGTINLYDYGSSRPGTHFRESFLRTSVSTRL